MILRYYFPDWKKNSRNRPEQAPPTFLPLNFLPFSLPCLPLKAGIGRGANTAELIARNGIKNPVSLYLFHRPQPPFQKPHPSEEEQEEERKEKEEKAALNPCRDVLGILFPNKSNNTGIPEQEQHSRPICVPGRNKEKEGGIKNRPPSIETNTAGRRNGINDKMRKTEEEYGFLATQFRHGFSQLRPWKI